MPAPTSPAARATYDHDAAHVFRPWSKQSGLDPMVVEGAKGTVVTDSEGRDYLDFGSQLVYVNVGHGNPRVAAAIAEEAGRLATIQPAMAVASRSEAARLVAKHLPEGMNKVFFTNGGADAVEHAIRMARLHTGRYKVLSAYRGYHGATQQAMTTSGDPRRFANDYGVGGNVHFFGPFLYRSAYNATTEAEECERALAALEDLIVFEGPSTIAAFIMETIPGTAGIMPPPPGYLAGVRELCDRYGIVMILDEVMAGFGRTGSWFAFEHYDVVPDLVTFAKGVTSGYVPMGGVGVHDRIVETFAEKPYPGGLTYSGHPLASAAAVAAIGFMEDEGVVDNARRIGEEVLGPGLAELAERHPCVGEVRGLGCFFGLDLVRNPETREPLSPYGTVGPESAAIVAACRDAGLLVFPNMHRIHLCPPLTVTDDEVRRALEILDRALLIGDEAVEAATGAVPAEVTA